MPLGKSYDNNVLNDYRYIIRNVKYKKRISYYKNNFLKKEGQILKDFTRTSRREYNWKQLKWELVNWKVDLIKLSRN